MSNCSEELNLCHGYDPYVMFDSDNKFDEYWLVVPYFMLACLLFFIAKTLRKSFSRAHFSDEDEEDVVEDKYEEAIEMASVWNWNENKLRCDVS